MEDAIPFNVLGHEDAMACQVLEIIGGIAPKALQTLEEPSKEMDVWSMEEGDDSVFYSDEDTTQEEAILETRRPVSSEDDESLLGEEQQEDEEIVSLNVDVEVVTNVKDEEEIVKIENEIEEETVNPSSLPILETLVNTREEDIQLNNTDLEAETTNNVEKIDLKAELEDSTPAPKIPEDPLASNQPSTTNLLLPLEVYREPEKLHGIQDGFQDPSEGPSIPSLSKKKSSHPKSFNHLTSSKYSTTSYRKIRRGNTRQKIQEFEYMIMNL